MRRRSLEKKEDTTGNRLDQKTYRVAEDGERVQPRERFVAALNLEEPDRVPLFELEFQYPEKVTGITDLTGEAAKKLIEAGKASEVDQHNLKNKILLCRKAGYDAFPLYKIDLVKEAKRLAPEIAVVGGCPHVAPMPTGMGALDTIRKFYFDRDGITAECSEMTKRAVEVAKTWVDEGVEIIRGGLDDMAAKEGPYLPPRMYDEIIFPHLRVLVGEVHKAGGKILVHSDGDLRLILDGLVDTGIDALHSIDPSAGMDIGWVKEVFGDRICLFGNVDCAWVLTRLGPTDVSLETRRCITKASPGGGHVLCSSNVIHKAVPRENALAMIEAGRKYGVYPIRRHD